MKYILFGAGRIGDMCRTFLPMGGVECFVDNDVAKHNTYKSGIPVFSYYPDALKGKWTIVSTSGQMATEISCQLEEDGIYSYLLWDEIISLYSTSVPNFSACINPDSGRDKEALLLKLKEIYSRCFMLYSVVVSLGQRCNFRCKNCGNMTPSAPKEVSVYSVEDICQWVETLLKEIPFIMHMQIQGGEPFLHPELEKILHYIGENKSIYRVVIATNGSIFPKQSVLDAIKKYRMDIRISDYGLVDMKVEKLYKLCKEMGIYVQYYQFAGDDGRWFDMGQESVPREQNDGMVKKRFSRCAFRNCLTLERGELYHCSRSPNAHLIQGFDRKMSDCVRADAGIHVIKNYIREAHYMEACRYCYGTDKPIKLVAAEQKHAKEVEN